MENNNSHLQPRSDNAKHTPAANFFFSKWMQRIIFLVKIVIASTLIWILLNRLNYRELSAAFSKIDIHFFALAALLMPINIFGQIVKWRFLLVQLKKNITWRESGLSLIAGLSLGLVTPGRVGELGRAFFIKGLKRSHVAGMVLVEKIFSALLIALFGTWSIWGLILRGCLDLSSTFWLVAAIVTTAFVSGILVFSQQAVLGLIRGYCLLVGNDKLLHKAQPAISYLTRTSVIRYFSISLFYYFIVASQYYLFMRAFEFFPAFGGYLMVFSIIAAKSLFPISFGDLGVRETAAIFFVTLLGGQEATAFNASILIFLINLALPALLGLLLVFTQRSNTLFTNSK